MSEIDKQVRATMAACEPFIGKVPEEFRESRDELSVMQVNVTYACNIACTHCHLECGPLREETMSRETMQHCLDVFTSRGFKTLDITGGAPEMNPNLEWFLREAASRTIPIMLRSNLVILEDPKYAHFAELYAELGVNVIASLPHYKKRNMEKQRGADTFDPVIRMLQKLNSLGYGKGDEGRNANGQLLKIDLVFNPAGGIMPPDQDSMEREYKRRLKADFDIDFDNLFTFTNSPGGRFAKDLERKGVLGRYMQTLIDAFNPDTVEAMMCRDEISVRWDGALYDCDFAQAIGLPRLDAALIEDLLDVEVPLRHKIALGNYCYACTAGAGGS